jgi:hypothetical protein
MISLELMAVPGATQAREQLHRLLDEQGGADALREALLDGNVRGDVYWWAQLGGCGCVLGTVVAARTPDLWDTWTIAHSIGTIGRFGAVENWADTIRIGDYPDYAADEDSGPFRAALLVSWIDEWKEARE